MVYSTFAINFFVALFALIDPIGNVALFAAVTAEAKPGERAQIALLIAVVVTAFLIFFYFTGVGLLQFFGISLPAFRIAGGGNSVPARPEDGARRLHRGLRRRGGSG